MYIFDRCHRDWAAETPGKYKREPKYITYTFGKCNISRNRKSNERSLSSPHPWASAIMMLTDFEAVCWIVSTKIHYDDVIMDAIASQITSLTIVYSNVYSGADQSKHQSSASLAFVWGIHRGPVNSPHKWPVTRKMFPFDDVIMFIEEICTRMAFCCFVVLLCRFVVIQYHSILITSLRII